MLNLKRLCFAAAAVTFGSAALAQINSPSNGPSDVFLAVWNPNTNQSVVQDLGITQANFEAAVAGNQTFNIDGSTFATDLGGTAGDLYVVFSGNANGAAAANNFFNGTYADFTGTVAPPGSILNQGSVQAVASAVGVYVDTQMATPNRSLVVASGANNSAYWAKGVPAPNPGKTLGGPLSFNASGALGSNLNYYVALNNAPADDSDSAPQVTQFAGFWNLDAAGKLTWTANSGGPQTPLPAAVWMLLSGLLGLGTVSRRKAV